MHSCWHSRIRLFIIISFVSAVVDAVLIIFSLLQLGGHLPVTSSSNDAPISRNEFLKSDAIHLFIYDAERVAVSQWG